MTSTDTHALIGRMCRQRTFAQCCAALAYQQQQILAATHQAAVARRKRDAIKFERIAELWRSVQLELLDRMTIPGPAN